MTTTEEAGVRSPRRERTRERLLDAAFEVFARQGVQGASIEAVCEAAGFTRGAFYSNFENKEELFLALMDRETRTHVAALEAALKRLDPDALRTPAGLHDGVRSVIGAVGPDPAAERQWCVMTAEFELLALRDPGIAPRYVAEQRRMRAEVADALDRLLAGLGLRFAVEPRLAVELLLGAYETGARSALLGATDAPDAGALVEALVDALVAPAETAGQRPTG